MDNWEYTHYAFISYKREDEKWAKWLQDKLEHYKFPTNINSRTDLPKHIRPTFRDVTDLKPGVLAEEINNALRDSIWLIVICSPRSAKSPWVCKEAQTFIDLGRADHIIPFVIEGIPFSDDSATECYPEALLNLTGSNELLAANINEMGRDAAAIKVVARMFNLRFDSLWQRYERERRRIRWMWRGGSVLFALIGLSIGGYFVKQNRTIERQKEELANHISKIQKDSILLSLQKDSIKETNRKLELANDELSLSNSKLKKANYEILQERNNLLIAQSKTDAEKALSLVRKGDSYAAAFVAANALPRNIDNPNRPFVFEAEDALRISLQSKNAILEHSGEVNIAVFSPDNSLIASGCNNGIIYLWNANNGKLYKKMNLYNGYLPSYKIPSVYDICFSADGKEIASCSTDSVHIWNADPNSKHFGEKLHSWYNSDYISSALIYCHNQDAIAIYSPYKITIRNKETGIVERSFDNRKFKWVRFSKDGRLYAAELYNENDIYIGDLTSGEILTKLNGLKGEIKQIGFSMDSNKLVAKTLDDSAKIIRNSWENSTVIWDIKTGNKIKTMKEKDWGGATVSLNYNGSILTSTDTDNSILVTDIESGTLLHKLSGHKENVNSIRFSSDGNLILSASDDKTVRLWDIGTTFPINEIKFPFAHNTKAVFSPDDNLIAYNESHDLVLLCKSDYSEVARFVHPNYINSFSFSPDGQKIVTCAYDTIRIWDIKKRGVVMKFTDEKLGPQKNDGGINTTEDIIYSNDGKYLFCSSSHGRIFVWDSMTGKKIAFNKDGGTSIAISSDDNNIVWGDHQYINYLNIWDWKSNKLSRIGLHNDLVTQVCYSPNKQMIASICLSDNDIYLWNRTSGRLIMRLTGHAARITSISFSPNGRYLVSSSEDSSVRVWDVITGIVINCFRVDNRLVEYSRFSSSGNLIISCHRDFGIRIWHWPTLKEIVNRASGFYEK